MFINASSRVSVRRQTTECLLCIAPLIVLTTAASAALLATAFGLGTSHKVSTRLFIVGAATLILPTAIPALWCTSIVARKAIRQLTLRQETTHLEPVDTEDWDHPTAEMLAQALGVKVEEIAVSARPSALWPSLRLDYLLTPNTEQYEAGTSTAQGDLASLLATFQSKDATRLTPFKTALWGFWRDRAPDTAAFNEAWKDPANRLALTAEYLVTEGLLTLRNNECVVCYESIFAAQPGSILTWKSSAYHVVCLKGQTIDPVTQDPFPEHILRRIE